ncbi:MAG TPA: 2-dehydropantoate 2-reductase [Ferrovibrio sp.]|uniref:ketopantoate reductase family protein n=1 Tax=Ferrovibrio sp. TaxID=1917215 RepID=UPI002ED1313F
MKIAIVGAGAIGGYLGGMLARGGHDVTLIARGAHRDAIRQNGLTIESRSGNFTVHPACTDDPAQAGPQDYVILSLKAPAIPDMAEKMLPLFGPETAVVTAMNGVPYWYFYRHGGPLDGTRLQTVDPGEKQWGRIGPERAIGSVVWIAGAITAPGVIHHGGGSRLPLGEPDGRATDRVNRLSQALSESGIEAPVLDNIRQEIWTKLWGNLSYNPVSVLTFGTLESMSRDPDARRVIAAMMEESRNIGEALGIRFPLTIEERMAAAEKVGAHKTSMLQDLESGKPMEIGALIGVIAELGQRLRIATPTLDTVLALVKARARAAGTYREEI